VNNSIKRNPGATIFLTSEDEWYKAAYYDPGSMSYFANPSGSNAQMNCAAPTATANSANCNAAVGNRTNVGSYTGSLSPYGTFDQGGNVEEWNEAIFVYAGSSQRSVRGGTYDKPANQIPATGRIPIPPAYGYWDLGFRVAPEPGGDLLVMAGTLGVLGLAAWRRARA
jgi:formylglycine-generating enzyme